MDEPTVEHVDLELGDAYEEAWADQDASGDADLWEVVSPDPRHSPDLTVSGSVDRGDLADLA